MAQVDHEKLLLKAADILELLLEPDSVATQRGKHKLVQSVNEFNRDLLSAKEHAQALPGGELLIEEQDEIIEMLEQLKERKRQILLKFSNDIAHQSASEDTKMERNWRSTTHEASKSEMDEVRLNGSASLLKSALPFTSIISSAAAYTALNSLYRDCVASKKRRKWCPSVQHNNYCPQPHQYRKAQKQQKIFKTVLHPSPVTADGQDAHAPEAVLLKHRFHKHYRHPNLDTSLTKARVAGEARALMKCMRAGVNVPGIRMVDASEGVLGIEWIEGKSVRFLLGGGAEGEEEVSEGVDFEEEEDAVVEEDPLAEYAVSPDEIMQMIGTEIATMHLADVIHGDLTTSNMMLRHPSTTRTGQTELVLIDFGLAYISTLVEDKAVDLYVLERAFSSTHPASEPLFASVLRAYEKKMGKEWKAIGRRLDDVRLRGRKRSMVG
ncbi:hypothetical protein NM688_g4087 [Phlebia brevispora]|uniref:Uncharacterized protein n=1 Tax=Phlebia brevispora TaxID=194682 RepID=A0ACC1T447_9APHY|nr:hypothetical protein NM688_g4087 [Phlebia brevispora]